ncbi:Phytolongin Phyl1.1 [Rhynchospora pubera]|uniref:Phytolongin Phyl1.1 n=1 Tax=Rhynchospora pubera TaxID=906938 RepID=A0AAV8BXB4_9POAL|nr:Phytolongin Phyl1.1 [Rhynchospora pubera]
MTQNPDGITNCPIEPTNPSTGPTFYCCFARGRKILYQYNRNGPEIEALAALCLEQTPPYHKWFFHTVGTRTYGFLMSDHCTYFAIVEPTMGSIVLHDFLNRVHQVFISVSKRNLESTLAPVIARFVESLEQMQRNDGSIVIDNDELFNEPEMLVRGHSKRKKREKRDKKSKRNEIEMEEIAIVREGEGRERGLRMDVLGNGEERGADGIERNRLRRQLSGRRAMWWTHVKYVAAIDAVICLVLLGVWLVVCQGFKCVR